MTEKINMDDMDSSNAKRVEIGELTLYFSYKTLVAFDDAGKLTVSTNRWSTTTGKCLNQIDGGDKKSRLSSEDFNKAVEKMMRKYRLIPVPTITETKKKLAAIELTMESL